MGCKVYGVEPNEEFRKITQATFAKKYPNQFISIDDKADSFKLGTASEKVAADLIVTAQALHTYRKEHTGKNENNTRAHWQSYLPQDSKEHIAIWYYNG